MDKTEQGTWLQEFFSRLPDGIVVLAPDGTILDANPAFARLIGLASENVIGKIVQDLIPPDQRNKWIHDLDKLTRGIWTWAEGINLPGKDHRIPIQLTLVARTSYANQPAFILHVRNVAVFHTVEQALIASEDQWARSFDAITDLMCVLDRSGRILRANRAMTQRFQVAHGKLIGRNYRDIFGCLALSGAAGANDIIGTAPCTIEELMFPQTEGWFSLSVYPLKNEQNVATGAVLIAKDITEAHTMRESLKRSEAGLRQASKMEAIGRLAGGVAHDFNNLLTSILGFGSLILRSLKDDDPNRNDIQEIVRAGERATTLTQQLLYFSHEQKLETKAVQLNAVINNITSFLRRTLGEDIKLSTRLADGLWNIRADISRLEQILINLSINARDAMPRGGELVLETSNRTLDNCFYRIHPGMQAGEYVRFEVSDTGQGMPPEILDHIFEPFFTTKEKGKGTGLGLTTVYGIVRQFDGYISCYSEVGRGTTFTIYLPRCLDEREETAVVIPEADLPRGRETVLVVDDEPNIVAMISQLLKELGYQVLTSASSAQALTLGEAHPDRIDLILTDIIMPELSGVELVRTIAKKRPDIKILFMSGYADGIARQAGELNPDDNYLSKPFSLQTLALRVRQALDQTARPGEALPPGPNTSAEPGWRSPPAK